MTTIRAKSLTTFSVAPDGANIAIGVADDELRAGVLTLPNIAKIEIRDAGK